jgi:hypothetical protein
MLKKMDKIDSIKALLLKRFEYHARALEDVKAKLKRIEEVEGMLLELGDIPDDVCYLGDPDPQRPYMGMGLTAAVHEVLKHAVGTPRTLKELREMLVRGGFDPPKENFSESLNATLHRLATKGLVTVAKDGEDRKTFQATGVDLRKEHHASNNPKRGVTGPNT